MKEKDYTKRARLNYKAKHDFITLTLDKGTKERMRQQGKTNQDLAKAIYKWLDRLEEKAR